MNIKPLKPLDDKITVFGMSCSGKTTFAQKLVDHHYYCFDAMYPWHTIETFGMSITSALTRVASQCISDKFVLDGWQTSDLEGRLLPESVVYVVYTSYEEIIEQYRISLTLPMSCFHMFQRWYSYSNHNARYFLNRDDFVETTYDEYRDFISCELERNQ